MLNLLRYISKRRTPIIFSSGSKETCGSNVTNPSFKNPEPISLDEFGGYFRQCMPEGERHKSIALAFSGGPDSTCLLYLLKQLIEIRASEGFGIENVVAVTINHGLQAASNQMTEQCVSIASSLQVRHRVIDIPWGIAPFPALPSGDRAFENLAREARYHLLLSALREEDISTIAYGHHADDQLETALIRVSRGSSEAGVAGMRKRRLWGMGFGAGPEALGWAGQYGMDRWIIRPLLSVPKERIIATCKAHGLDYVIDKTNFQPDTTPRNRIRHLLKDPSSEALAAGRSALQDMAAKLAISEKSPQQAHGCLPEGATTPLARLRSTAESIASFVENLNHEAAAELKNCLRASPASTILLSREAFSRVTSNSVRLEIIRRVLRFVSPLPWGSPRAEAGRRSASLQRISNALYSQKGCQIKANEANVPPKPLAAGSGVVWSPVYLRQDGKMNFSDSGDTYPSEPAWLASRQPPIIRYGDTAQSSLELDITPAVLFAFSQGTTAEVLYDFRFLLHIHPRLLPSEVLNVLAYMGRQSGEISGEQAPARLIVVPHTRYFLPKIVLRRTAGQAELLRDGDYERQKQENPRDHEIARLLPDGSTRLQPAMGENNKDGTRSACDREAVRIKYIRVLDDNALDK